jgi:tRNA (cmo5U34)-methyltransferase
MRKEEVTALFDKQAASYDQQWGKTAPINSALHLLTSAVLAGLPSNANVLCVGAGTGNEILYFAQRFPGWRFTAVEPSTAMLNVLRNRAEERGITSRCVFHSGYLDSLPSGKSFDAATAFLVSQFTLERKDRSNFFRSIASRLCSGGILVSSDLAGDLDIKPYRDLLDVWFRMMRSNGTPPDGIEKMREAYRRDVAVLSPQSIGEIISLGGFDSPVLFFQAGLIHAWYAKRS